jgi:hypothetical protein
MQKKHKRPRKSVSNLEDHDHGDLDDPLEPLQNGDEDEEILQDPLVDSENEYQDLAELDTTISGVSAESGSIKIVCRFHITPHSFPIILQVGAYVLHIDM